MVSVCPAGIVLNAQSLTIHYYTLRRKLKRLTQINKNSCGPANTATSSVNAHAQTGFNHVLLGTAVVYITDANGQMQMASMTNFVTAELAQSLQLKREKKIHIIFGIGKIGT